MRPSHGLLDFHFARGAQGETTRPGDYKWCWDLRNTNQRGVSIQSSWAFLLELPGWWVRWMLSKRKVAGMHIFQSIMQKLGAAIGPVAW